jgi:hypothetical protein
MSNVPSFGSDIAMLLVFSEVCEFCLLLSQAENVIAVNTASVKISGFIFICCSPFSVLSI